MRRLAAAGAQQPGGGGAGDGFYLPEGGAVNGGSGRSDTLLVFRQP